MGYNWNPSAKHPEDFGGFNFSTEDKILRWLLRGDTIYDVEIPDDAEVIECENKNTYFQCLTFLALRNYDKVCEKIVKDKVNKDNVKQAIETFTTFFELQEKDKNDGYRRVYGLLNQRKGE